MIIRFLMVALLLLGASTGLHSFAHAKIVMFKDVDGKEKPLQIFDDMLKAHPDLVDLIMESNSIDSHEEKQFWLDIYPTMNVGQVEKLKDILLKEKRRLGGIEVNYEVERERILKKYVLLARLRELAGVSSVEGVFIPYRCEAPFVGVCFASGSEIASSLMPMDTAKTDSSKKGGAQKSSRSSEYWHNKMLHLADATRIFRVGGDAASRGLLIDYAVYISRNIKPLEEIFGRDDVVEFIKGACHRAAQSRYIAEADELLRFLRHSGRDNCPSCASMADNVELSLSLMKNNVTDAANVLGRMRGAAETGRPWLSIGDIYEVLARSVQAENQIALRDNVISLLNQIPTDGEAAQFLDAFTGLGKGESELALLDFVVYVFRDKLPLDRRRVISDYIIKKHKDKNYYNKAALETYMPMMDAYFNGTIVEYYKEFKDTFTDKMIGGKKILEGEVYERAFYAAAHLIKIGRLDQAAGILTFLDSIGRSERSDAFAYIEVDGKDFARSYIEQLRSDPLWQMRQLINRIPPFNPQQWLLIASVSTLGVFSVMLILFPHSPLFRSEVARRLVFSDFNPLLLLARPLILWRVVRHCARGVFQPVRMVPFAGTIGRADFERRYIPVRLRDHDQDMHELIAAQLRVGANRTILLRGEGGVGKSLTAYRAAIELQKCGYVPVVIDYRLLPEDVKPEGVGAIVHEFYPDGHAVFLLERFGFGRYVFVIDNADTGSITRLLSLLLGRFSEARAIVTSRTADVERDADLTYDMTANSICFERFLDGIRDKRIQERIALFRKFILTIRNALLIAILLDTKMDITDLVGGKDVEKIEAEIIEKYTTHQFNAICDRFFANMNRKNVSYALKFILARIASAAPNNLIAARSALVEVGALKGSQDVFTSGLIVRLLESQKVKGELGLLEVLLGSSIIEMLDETRIRFAHDRLYEHFQIASKQPEFSMDAVAEQLQPA